MWSFKTPALRPSLISAVGVKSPHLQLLRVDNNTTTNTNNDNNTITICMSVSIMCIMIIIISMTNSSIMS